jgi:hypothetical protein
MKDRLQDFAAAESDVQGRHCHLWYWDWKVGRHVYTEGSKGSCCCHLRAGSQLAGAVIRGDWRVNDWER